MQLQVLPNGYMVLLGSPREMVQLSDQLLEPAHLNCPMCGHEIRDGFPWQTEESQMIAMDFRLQFRKTMEHMSKNTLMNASGQIIHDQEVREKLRQKIDPNTGEPLTKEQVNQMLAGTPFYLGQPDEGVEDEEPDN